MPYPSELFAVARLLAASGADQPLTIAQLRRAVSTAYYAVFHKLLQEAAERFVGAGNEGRAAYGLVYRGFSHGRMRSVCASITVLTLSATLQRQLKTTAASAEMRGFARRFMELQDARHRADYDPQAVFTHADAIRIIAEAEAAADTFDLASDEERMDVLALMLAGGRE